MDSPEVVYGVSRRAFAEIRTTLDDFSPQLTPREVGSITSLSFGIVEMPFQRPESPGPVRRT